jgi:hypothetical protein
VHEASKVDVATSPVASRGQRTTLMSKRFAGLSRWLCR